MKHAIRLLPVFVLACQSKQTKPAEQQPAPPPTVATPSDATSPTSPAVDAAVATGPRTACDTIVMQIDSAGVWLGAPPSVRCFAPRKGKALDAAWLAAELGRLRTAIDSAKCPSGVELAIAADATYQEAVTAMDAARQAGFTAVAMTSPAAQAMTFTAPPAAATSCTDRVEAGAATGATAPGAVLASARTHVSAATPLVVVTGDAISANRAQVATVAEVAGGEGPIAALATALGTAKSERTVIVQADAATSAKVMNRVIETARGAGYADVIFAVKQPKR